MRTPLKGIGTFFSIAVLSIGLVACGGDDDGSGGSGSGGEGSNAKLVCGSGQGGKPTGTPIKLGAVITKQPSVDFSTMSGAARAYFDCVNANGGINGHPIEYVVETEQSNPQQVASVATKLIETEKVAAIVGSASLIDCAVNGKLYEQKGYNVIAVGAAQECFNTPSIAPVNAGPYYSQVGTVQYLVDDAKVEKVVSIAQNQPGYALNNKGAIEYAKSKGVEGEGLLENVPVSDPNSVALRAVQAAGDGGGVALLFNPPDAIAILKAAEQQGLTDRVTWACAAPCYDAGVIKALGPAWSDKLFINAELNLITAKGADSEQFRRVMERYGRNVPLGAFAQMGFLAAKMASDAIEALPDKKLTQKGINEAIKGINNYKTDMLCDPWYFGDLKQHVAVGSLRTVKPVDGKFVEAAGCKELPALPSNPLAEVRKEAAAQGLR